MMSLSRTVTLLAQMNWRNQTNPFSFMLTQKFSTNNQVLSKWSSYRHRFLPWMLFNLKHKLNNNYCHQFSQSDSNMISRARSPRTVSSGDDKIVPDQQIQDQLIEFFTLLNKESHKKSKDGNSLQVMEKYFGFTIERKTSTIHNGGNGVFITKGRAKQKSLVALYPGTIYKLMEPLLLPSIGNPYIFQCIDGIRIDGKDRGISRSIFKSCVYRDLCWPYLPADLSWLTNDLKNPLNVGQYVNNQTPDFPCNVSYQECNLPLDIIPYHLQPYLPNIYYSGYSDQSSYLRIVALIATKDIEFGTELFSTYYTVVHE